MTRSPTELNVQSELEDVSEYSSSRSVCVAKQDSYPDAGEYRRQLGSEVKIRKGFERGLEREGERERERAAACQPS